MLGLFVLVPLLRRGLSWHETSVSLLVCSAIVGGLLGAAAAKRLWPDFALAICLAGGALQVNREWKLKLPS